MSRQITDLYTEARIQPPKGTGAHTRRFHVLAVKLMKSGMDRNRAYATAMKTLGRDKSVHKSHRRYQMSSEQPIVYLGRKRYALLGVGIGALGATAAGSTVLSAIRRKKKKKKLPVNSGSGNGTGTGTVINVGGTSQRYSAASIGRKLVASTVRGGRNLQKVAPKTGRVIGAGVGKAGGFIAKHPRTVLVGSGVIAAGTALKGRKQENYATRSQVLKRLIPGMAAIGGGLVGAGMTERKWQRRSPENLDARSAARRSQRQSANRFGGKFLRGNFPTRQQEIDFIADLRKRKKTLKKTLRVATAEGRRKKQLADIGQLTKKDYARSSTIAQYGLRDTKDWWNGWSVGVKDGKAESAGTKSPPGALKLAWLKLRWGNSYILGRQHALAGVGLSGGTKGGKGTLELAKDIIDTVKAG